MLLKKNGYLGCLVIIAAAVSGAALAQRTDPQPFIRMIEPAKLPVTPGTVPEPTIWESWGNTVGNIRFSAADQINLTNVGQIEPIWKYSPPSDAATGVWQTTPLVINGVMYITDPSDGAVALEPETGKVLWTFRVPDRALKMRGVSYWPGDAAHGPRIIYGIFDRVYALDPATGKQVPGFGGAKGYVDLTIGMTEKFPDNEWQITSPPAIFGNVFVVAGASARWAFTSRGSPVDPRGFDIITGEQLWRFNIVPRPGQPNAGSWGPDGWQDRSGPSAWGIMAVDKPLGLVYIPIGTANPVYVGTDRPGDNLYASSVIALDAKTGAYRWHFQTTRHDIWDYDVGNPPALIDITVKGEKIPALVIVTKVGLMFILDRRTGKPVFGVEERPVPTSEIPGEITSPTQPFPIKPPPLAKLGVKRSELSQVTPESNRYCNEIWDREGLRDTEVYTPMRLNGASIFTPSNGGGTVWGGVSFNPELGYIFVSIRNSLGFHKVEEDGKGGVRGGYGSLNDLYGLPCLNPPWAEFIAVNANTGDIAWRRPLGVREQLGDRGLHLGNGGNGGSVATKGGLVFIGATGDARFRAFDALTGREVWVWRLPAVATSSPMSFVGKSGRQYVLIASGSSKSDHNLIAFAIPRVGETPVTLIPRPAPPIIDIPSAIPAGRSGGRGGNAGPAQNASER